VGVSGTFSATDERFAANSSGTAQDSSDRVIYNTSTGDLWYDVDGAGQNGRLLIGILQGAPGLAATDIEVVNGTAPSGSVINGTSANDTLTGTSGDDTINGLGGNDLFVAGSTAGIDVIDGGAGRDSIEFKERATSAITVDFGDGFITGGSSGTISFANIERVVAGNFNDALTGNAASQTLAGQSGSDAIEGAGGVDTLWGGSGSDVFVFREMGTANADRISDYVTGSDHIFLDDAAFTAIGGPVQFSATDARFKANSSGTATDTSDRVVFNTATGQLYYDADGSASGAAQLIATVQAGASVAASDIFVI
jgi:Ca2+-binding RTX toxin-like protein